MKTSIYAFSLLVTWIPALQTACAENPPSGSKPFVQVGRTSRDAKGVLIHTVESPYQSGQTLVRVLLPKTLKDDRRYPVVYVLPVEARSESRYGDGLKEVMSHDLHNKFNAIFVAPTFSHLPWFADHPTDKHIQQETYFLKVVVPLIEQTYPAKDERGARLLLGFSKSGYGAWTLLLRHPQTFGKAAAWDAPMMMQQFGKYGNRGIYGSQANFEKYRVPDLLRANAKSFAGPSDRLILTGIGNFVKEHEAVHQLMTDLKIDHVYRDQPLRKHDWHSGWVSEAVELLFHQR
ncbi:MAG: alpha/beta hydrolase-fold protein [Planctomycetota bacterium]|nr:alpha/beta hydrolase-fold protein [Planctomycetota bacterium]